MDANNWIAIYAAVIGTSAFALNVRAWFESKPRLHVSLIPDGVVGGGGPDVDETDLVIVNVTNRGRVPVYITNLVIFEFQSRYARWLRRPTLTGVVAQPNLKGRPLNIPCLLEPSRIWVGVARKHSDKIRNMHTGNVYVGVCTSHREKPIFRRIPKSSDKAKRAVIPRVPPQVAAALPGP